MNYQLEPTDIIIELKHGTGIPERIRNKIASLIQFAAKEHPDALVGVDLNNHRCCRIWPETMEVIETYSNGRDPFFLPISEDSVMIERDDSSTLILSLDMQITNNAKLTPDQRGSLVRLLKTHAQEIEAVLALHPAACTVRCEGRSTGVGMTVIQHAEGA